MSIAQGLRESIERMEGKFAEQTRLALEACALARKHAKQAEEYRTQAKMNLVAGVLIGLVIGVIIGYII